MFSDGVPVARIIPHRDAASRPDPDRSSQTQLVLVLRVDGKLEVGEYVESVRMVRVHINQDSMYAPERIPLQASRIGRIHGGPVGMAA